MDGRGLTVSTCYMVGEAGTQIIDFRFSSHSFVV